MCAKSLSTHIEENARPVPMTVFAALTRLRQMACDPRLIDPEWSQGESAKRETFRELVKELVSEGRRALVFSQFVELLTLWRADLEGHPRFERCDRPLIACVCELALTDHERRAWTHTMMTLGPNRAAYLDDLYPQGFC